MVIVVDTSVLIANARGVEGARPAIRGAVMSGDGLAASVLTRVELLAGMRASEERGPGVDPAAYVMPATVERLNARL